MLRLLMAVLCAALASVQALAAGRGSVSIVGSSTLYPFAAVVAERFGRTTEFRAPIIEATGSGGGFKLFCSGVGARTPDITNASRRIKRSEFEGCRGNGVTEILEVPVGYDGIVIANAKSSPGYDLSLRDIYLALAKLVPGEDGRLIPNPHLTWRDVNPDLPAVAIEILGPPPTSGTRDAFVELALGRGAETVASLQQLRQLPASRADAIADIVSALGLPGNLYGNLARRKGSAPTGAEVFAAIVYAVREDGAYIDAGENDNLVVQKLRANPDAFGILGFSFLDENTDRIQGASIDGVAPTYDAIARGSYPISRPLYVYVKVAHIGRVPGIAEYVAEFVSERAMGEDGYLPDRGLVPLDATAMARVRASVSLLTPMVL
mgnify:CR=1 FL=1